LHRLELGDEVLESNLLSVVEAKSDDWMPRENACTWDSTNSKLIVAIQNINMISH